MLPDEHKEKTLSFFREAALEKEGFYDAEDSSSLKHSFWQRWVRQKLTARILKSDPENVLDVGCGNGDFVRDLAQKFPALEFEGRDFSPEMVQLATENSSLLNLSYQQADLLEVEPGDPQYDLVLCHNMFHHLHPKDVEQGLYSLAWLSRRVVLFELKPWECLWNRHFRSQSLFPINLISRRRVIDFFKSQGFTHQYTWNIFFLPFFSPISIVEFHREP